MTFLSLCSGIEAASLAWIPLDWKCVAVAEIEPFPSAILKYHYPDVINLGDVNKITEEKIKSLGKIDVVIFGFPCQDVSQAGRRKGLKNADGTFTRSGLFYQCERIATWSSARWSVAENVFGLFSIDEGGAFASVVGELAGADLDVPESGWGTTGVAIGPKGLVEWIVLDAQWFGVAQRRRRVFIVRDSGEWFDRPPLFLNAQSLRRDFTPSRETRKSVTGTLGARTSGGGGLGTELRNFGGGLVPTIPASGRGFARTGESRGQDFVIPIQEIGNRQSGDRPPGTTVDTVDTLVVTGSVSSKWAKGTGGPSGDEAYNLIASFQPRCGRNGHGADMGDKVNALQSASTGTSDATPCVASKTMVRRLTPKECERLQGLPDDWTKIPWRNKTIDQCPDGPRYRAIGNSMAVPVIRYIGERISKIVKYR
jgi:DNA (cytosine-5)-methyltransferase 1